MKNSKKNACSQTDYFAENHGKKSRKEYFNRMYKKSKLPWYHNCNYDRYVIVTINRIRANHYNLNASLARSKSVESSMCKCEEFEETIDHVLWQCALYNDQRKKMIEKLRKNKFQLPLSTELFVMKPNLYACKIMTDFLKHCNLRI